MTSASNTGRALPTATPACAACGSPLPRAAERVQGYVEGSTHLVRTCGACGTASADPGDTDLGALYRSIYEHADRLPGYARYAHFAREVADAPDALAYLAAAEITYRAVAHAAAALPPARTRILEVGSGLGYLTYALRQRGYSAIGVDLSTSAVAAANARYGPYYESVTLEERARRADDRFDLVVMTELVEHVADVRTLLRQARALLSPGGAIVVTTPSRDAYPPAAVWRTEHPPVHLHWFTSAGLERLAERAGLTCELLPLDREPGEAMAEANERPSILGRDGAPSRPSLRRRVVGRVMRLVHRVRPPAVAPRIVGGTLVALFRVRDDG